MTLTPERREAIRRLGILLDRVPDEMWVDILDTTLRFQGYTQENTARIRALFPGVLWHKRFVKDGCNWWEYTTVFDGVNLCIYAVAEAPPTCRAVVEEVEVEKQIPTAFETVRVKEQRVRWECDGNDEVTA